MEILKGEMSFTVAVDATDCLGRLKLGALMRFAQDLATEHADRIGVGFEALYRRNLIWVQTRMNAKLTGSPVIGEQIRAVTYPHFPGLAECVRDYYFYRSDSTEFARITSSWCLLDVVSRRIAKQKEYFKFPAEAYFAEYALPDAEKRFALPERLTEAYRSVVRYCETDRNRHLNNAYYGDMIQNALPSEVSDAYDFASFDIRFLHELTCGQAYEVFTAADETYRYTRATSGELACFEARVALRPHVSDPV